MDLISSWCRFLLCCSVIGIFVRATVESVESECFCCDRNATAVECTRGAVDLRSRPDCSCCSVCSSQLGEQCDSRSQPCADNLDCANGVCAAAKACRSDHECVEDRFCLGQVCFDPCTILDPCRGSLLNGVCTTRRHRPVCSCPADHQFLASARACVPRECLSADGGSIDVGKQFYSGNCRHNCVCGDKGLLNCTTTVCPPGSYIPGSFANDSLCVELRDIARPDACCVNVFCSNIAPETPPPPPTTTTATSTDGDSAFVTQHAISSNLESSSSESHTNIGYQPAAFTMLAVGHNWTQLQLPSGGGSLNYFAQLDSRPVSVELSSQADASSEADGSLFTHNVTGLQPDTLYTFTWSVSNDVANGIGDVTDDLLKVYTLPGCSAANVSYGIGETYTIGCHSTCYCDRLGPSCRPRCHLAPGAGLAGGATVAGDRSHSCREVPDPEDPHCCVKLECTIERPEHTSEFRVESISTETTPNSQATPSSQDTPISQVTPGSKDTPIPANTAANSFPVHIPFESQPTLLVTAKTADSVTLAWDDFKPQNYLSSYVVQYRAVAATPAANQTWRRQLLPPGDRHLTLPLLRVNNLLPSTEYEVRVSFYKDAGHQLLGPSTETIRFFTNDGCFYGNKTYSIGAEFHENCSATCTCQPSGQVLCNERCPEPLKQRGATTTDRVGCYEKTVDECCAMIVCTDDDMRVQIGSNCSALACGDNYVCQPMMNLSSAAATTAATTLSNDQPMTAVCVCPVGFVEINVRDNQKECRRDAALLKSGCRYNDQIYQAGESFYKDCAYSCLCNSAHEIECKARCVPIDATALNAGCRVAVSVSDQCCQTIVCDTTEEEYTAAAADDDAAAAAAAVGVRECLWNGVAHNVGATVERGCESRCQCLVGGQWHCLPRCNTTVDSSLPHPDVTCTLQMDPSDKCCMSRVCTHPSSSSLSPTAATTTSWVSATAATTAMSPLLSISDIITSTTTTSSSSSSSSSSNTSDGATGSVTPGGSSSGRSSRLDPGPLHQRRHTPLLQLAALDQLNATSTRVRLRVSRDVLNTLLAGGGAAGTGGGAAGAVSRAAPLAIQWRRAGDKDDTGVDWNTQAFSAEQVTVLDVHTLLVTVTDPLLTRSPADLWLRAQFGDLVSQQTRAVDLVTSSVHNDVIIRDESSEVVQCVNGQFTCLTGKCIPYWHVCDFIYDCNGEEDELDCDVTTSESVVSSTVSTTSTTTAAAITSTAPALLDPHHHQQQQQHSVNFTDPPIDGATVCQFRGRQMQLAEEFHDGCDQFCICTRAGARCAPLDCPSQFGLELVNPDCLQWQQDPHFVPAPPECCPKMMCVDDGSCVYAGRRLRNFDEVPTELSGCERRCYCDYGNITCRSACSPLAASPPSTLPCSAEHASLASDGCCKHWQCDVIEETEASVIDPQVPSFENIFNSTGDIDNVAVDVQDKDSVRFTFSVPDYLVGLPGQTEILFTNKPDSDIQLWARRVYQEEAGLVGSAQLSYRLTGLSGNTSYTALVRQLSQLTNQVFSSRPLLFQTPPLPSDAVVAKWFIDPQLQAASVDHNSAQITWHRLNETVLGYVDGIQLRYRNLDANAQVWTMTPFIHRELTHHRLTELRPATSYQVDIVLMPFQHQSTEMVSSQPLQIRTLPVVDLYNFTISLEVAAVGYRSARVVWRGFPQPQYSYVNVYRVVFVDERQRLERQTFKLAQSATDQSSVTLTQLKPDSKYQVWLEAYLKNGKKRVSEVQEFITKPQLSDSGLPTDHGVLAAVVGAEAGGGAAAASADGAGVSATADHESGDWSESGAGGGAGGSTISLPGASDSGAGARGAGAGGSKPPSTGGSGGAGGGYFGAMLAAAGVAGVMGVVALLLLLALLRQSAGSKKKAPISCVRKIGPSYENPAFKRSELDRNGPGGNERFA